MNCKKLRNRCIAAILIAGMGGAMAGCGATQSQKTFRQMDDVFKIVILDSEDYYYSDVGIDQGIQKALADLGENTAISIERVDDGGDYVEGISLAKSLAADDTVDAVITFQNFESIGAEAGFFESAEKPFIVTMGCYDEVAENSYDYFLADFMSGKAIGSRIGEYLGEQGLKNIALCHSDTTFEKDEIRGIQSVIKNLSDSNIYYTQTGPFYENELAALLNTCDQMDIDAVVSNFYNQEDSAWLLSELHSRRPELTVIGDYALNSSDILEQYGASLEGVVIVPAYPYEESAQLESFIEEYQKEYQSGFSSAAIQYYDLIRMIGEYSQDGNVTGTELMQLIKSESGYQGVSGTIRFDENGCLVTENCPLFICKNKEFVLYEE